MRFYFYRWIMYWLTGIDCISGILTFGFWSPHLAVWWTIFSWEHGLVNSVGK